MTNTTIVTPFESQCEILVGMSDLYDTPEYEVMADYFKKHNEWAIALAFAFNSDVVTLEGVTDKYFTIVEQAYAELLDMYGIVEGRGFRGFSDFHIELEQKIKSLGK